MRLDFLEEFKDPYMRTPLARAFFYRGGAGLLGSFSGARRKIFPAHRFLNSLNSAA